MTRIGVCLLVCWCSVGLTGCGSGRAEVTVAPRPRPVTVFELRESQPTPELRHAGSVSPWKSQDVGFEVSGRVNGIIEPGVNVTGPRFDAATGAFVDDQSTNLAEISPTRYEVRLASSRASLETARARLSASEKEVRDVMPKRLLSAQASLDLARQEFGRISNLFNRQVETQQSLDKAQADLTTTEAELQQLEATTAVKESERASFAAQVNEAEEAVRQAQQDLDDTILRAPFQGQVSAVYETVGSVVQAGQPVVRLQMMDPIQVDVQVSAQTDARLNYNDIVQVFPPGEKYPVPAMVYEKAAVADAATRTFLVTLLIRNSQLMDGLPREYDPARDLRTRSVVALFAEKLYRDSPYFIHAESLYRDGDEYVVWRVKNVQRGLLETEIPEKLEVERVVVVPGDGRITFMSAATLRELTDVGKLDPASDVLLGGVQDMRGQPLAEEETLARLKSEANIYFVRERWRFRPGDIVQVELNANPIIAGLYIPMDAIQREGLEDGLASLFVVDEANGGSVVRQVRIRLQGQNVGALQKVEPVTPGELKSGDRVVAAGTHFLVDGEAVRVTSVAGER